MGPKPKSKPASKPAAKPAPKPPSTSTPKPASAVASKGKRNRKPTSSPEDKPKSGKGKPPSKKVKENTPSDDDVAEEEDSVQESTKQVVAKPKIGLITRRAKLGDGMKKVDIETSGARFVDNTTPLEVVSKYKLSNLERFNAVINRMNQTDQAGDEDDDEKSGDDTVKAAPTSAKTAKVQSLPLVKQSESTTTKTASKTIDAAKDASQPPAKSKAAQATKGLVQPDTPAVRQAQTTVQQSSKSSGIDFDFILQQPVIDSRNYEAIVTKEARSRFMMCVRYKPTGSKSFIEVLKVGVPQSGYQESECKAVVKDLARFCQRWPLPIAADDRAFKNNLLAAIAFQKFPSKGITLRNARRVANRYRFIIPLIDPKSGKTVDEETSVDWTEFETLKKPIPALPQYVATKSDTSLGNVKTSAEKNAVKFMKFVAWKFHSKIMSATSFRTAYEGLQLEYTGKKGVNVGTLKTIDNKVREANRRSGAPRPTQLFTFRHHSLRQMVTVYPSDHFTKVVGTVFKDIRIWSSSRARLAYVSDCMDQAEKTNPGDLIKVWKVGCQAADAMNEAVKRGDAPPSLCTCQSEEESSTTQHRCSACLKSVTCSTMLPDEAGDPVCDICARKDERTSKMKKVDLAKGRINLAVVNHIGREVNHWRSMIDKTDKEKIEARASMVSATNKQLCDQLVDGDKVPDAYTDAKRSLFPEPGARFGGRRDPFMASVEAVFPYGSFENERRLHSPDNTVHTTLWLNFMKNVFLPATLPLVAKWADADPATRDLDAFLKEMDDVYRCQRILGYNQKKRLAPKFSRTEYSRHLKMWKSAVPASLSSTASLKLYQYVLYAFKDGETDFIEKDRLLKIVKEIEKKFNVTMPRAKDGCPWAGVERTMPPGWGWGPCWGWFTRCQQREWDWCNRNFEQVDTTETLFLEWCFQFCSPDYVEFLGLPMVVFGTHPLRGMAGKKDHRKGMRTGWRNVKPTSIDDRDESMNNILFETCISNYLKNNFLDADCSRIRGEISRITLSKSHFDPELRNELLARNVDTDEDFLVEDIDDLDNPEDGAIGDDAGGADVDIIRVYESDDEKEDRNSVADEDEVREDEEETQAEPEQNPVLTELEDEEQMAAVKDLEGDVHRLAREAVNQQRAHLVGSLSHQELVRSAANANMEIRLQSMQTDTDAVNFLVNIVVKNRILQGVGVWAPTEDEDDEMLMKY